MELQLNYEYSEVLLDTSHVYLWATISAISTLKFDGKIEMKY